MGLPILSAGFARSAQVFSRLRRDRVVINATGLYTVQAVGYIVPLLTVPYLARVLQPAAFGLLSICQGVALWMSILVEFGFNLSASREVALSRSDPTTLRQTVASVQAAKMLLSLVCACVAWPAFCIFKPEGMPWLYVSFAVVQWIGYAFTPFWYFQGVERTFSVILVEVVTRTLGTALVFVLVRTPSHGWRVLALQAASGILSTGVPTLLMYRDVGFARTSFRAAVDRLRLGLHTFLLRSVQGLYSTGNSVLLGFFCPPGAVGLFAGAEKTYRAAAGLAMPMLQSLYPGFSVLAVSDQALATRRIRRICISSATMGCVAATLMTFFAPVIVRTVLGASYEGAIVPLRFLSWAIPMNFISTTLMVLWFLPHRREAMASKILLATICLDVALVAALASRFQEIAAAAAILASEATILLATLWTAAGRRKVSSL